MKPNREQPGLTLDQYGEIDLLAMATGAASWQRFTPQLLAMRQMLPPFGAIQAMNANSLPLLLQSTGRIADVWIPMTQTQVAVATMFLGRAATLHPDQMTRDASTDLAVDLIKTLDESRVANA